MNVARPLIIAIDGPAGAGKSSVSKILALRLGFTLVDTGAIYRCVALKASRGGVALDDVATEFPRINDSIQGRRAAFGYHPRVAKRADLMFDGLIKYAFGDSSAKAVETWNAPAGWFVGEASFAPNDSKRSEDDGFLVTFGTNAREQQSAAFVIDAKTMQLASTVHLPQRNSLGFHSYWCHGV